MIADSVGTAFDSILGECSAECRMKLREEERREDRRQFAWESRAVQIQMTSGPMLERVVIVARVETYIVQHKIRYEATRWDHEGLELQRV